MECLSPFERAVLDALLAGDEPEFLVLRSHAAAAKLSARQETGAGFILTFDVPLSEQALACPDFHFGDVTATLEGLKNGAGFVVFIRDGRLAALEGYSYDEDWPEVMGGFTLSYERQPRPLVFPRAIDRPNTARPRGRG